MMDKQFENVSLVENEIIAEMRQEYNDKFV